METTIRRSWKLQEFVAHKANVNCLAMGHKSNQVLATGGDDKKVNLWAIGRQSCLMMTLTKSWNSSLDHPSVLLEDIPLCYCANLFAYHIYVFIYMII